MKHVAEQFETYDGALPAEAGLEADPDTGQGAELGRILRAVHAAADPNAIDPALEAANTDGTNDALFNAEIANVVEAAQFNRAEVLAFANAMNRTRGDIFQALILTFESMDEDRAAAVVLAVLGQGIKENQKLAVDAFGEIQNLVAHFAGYETAMELDNPAINIDQIQDEVKKALEEVGAPDADARAFILKNTGNLQNLCDKLGVNGLGLVNKILENPATALNGLMAIMREAVNLREFDASTRVQGVDRELLQLLTPQRLMARGGAELAKMAA